MILRWQTFSDINCTNVFLGQSPKAIEIKMKINKWDLIKGTSFYTAKETIRKKNEKRQHTEWEKIFANDVTDKGLISKIYNHTTRQQRNNPIKTWAEDLKRNFPKEGLQIANRHMEMYSLLIIKELPIKNTMKYCHKTGDPFQGPRVGSFLMLRNDLCEEKHTDKARDFIGKGCLGREQQIKRTQENSATKLAVSCFMVMGFPGCLWPIFLTQSSSWWHMHHSAKMDSSKENSGRFVGRRNWCPSLILTFPEFFLLVVAC